MATPVRSDVHIDTLATNISVAYKNSNYIADQILPIVPVAKQTGKYAKFTKASWFRNEAQTRAPGTRAARMYWDMDTAGSYTCLEYAAATTLADEIRENADNPINPERTSVEFVTDKILLAREARVASLLFSTATFASYYSTCVSLTGGAQIQWNTYETSDPLQDVNQMCANVLGTIGMKPNVLVMGQDVYKALRIHPALLDRIKYSQMGIVTTELMARLFDVDKILVGTAIYDSSEEGTTSSFGYVWGDYVLVAYVTPRPALESPSLGYCLNFKKRVINRYREDQEHSDVFECLENSDEIVCAADAGYLLSDVLA